MEGGGEKEEGLRRRGEARRDNDEAVGGPVGGRDLARHKSSEGWDSSVHEEGG